MSNRKRFTPRTPFSSVIAGITVIAGIVLTVVLVGLGFAFYYGSFL